MWRIKLLDQAQTPTLLDIDIMHPLNSTLLVFEINEMKMKIWFENVDGDDTDVVKSLFWQWQQKKMKVFIFNKE